MEHEAAETQQPGHHATGRVGNDESTVDDLFGKASTDIQSALDEVAQ
jgi:hypothetical protein